MSPINDPKPAGPIKKRFLIFRHFGRFLAPEILTFVLVKPVLLVKRFGA